MNMNDCNAYMLYKRLHELHTPEHPLLETTEAMSKLTYALCQRGESMRKKKAKHPPHMTNVHAGGFATGSGRKVKFTKHGFIFADLAALYNIKETCPWRQHQSLALGKKRQMCVGGNPAFNCGGG